MAATSILMIIRNFHRSRLNIQYIKFFINCVTSYLTLQFIAIFHPIDDFFNFRITWACTWTRHGAISSKRRNHGTLNCWKSRLTMKINIQKKWTNINKLIWWRVWYTEYLTSVERSFWLSSILTSPPWDNGDGGFDVQVARIMRGG